MAASARAELERIAPATQDAIDAERLALRQSGASVDKYTIQLSIVHGNKLSDNARDAIQDTSSIAYIGEPEPGLSAGTVGITNSQDLLQVSPADTALELTRATPAVNGAPGVYFESQGSYGRTFARVVPTSGAEAQAIVTALATLHAQRRIPDALSQTIEQRKARQIGLDGTDQRLPARHPGHHAEPDDPGRRQLRHQLAELA